MANLNSIAKKLQKAILQKGLVVKHREKHKAESRTKRISC